MARLTKPLTDTEIKAAKPQEADYTLHDGDGLQLQIKSSGRKVWQMRYYRPLTKKRAKLSFGSYPAVTLADARKRRTETKSLIAKAIDPQEHYHALKRQALEIQSNTYKVVAERWLQLKKSSVTADYASDILRSLEKYIFPAISDISITDIKARTLVQAIKPVQARGALETVRRLCQRINEVMIYAMNVGLIDAAPSVNISKAFEKPQKKHMPSIHPDQLPQLMPTMRLANIELPTRCLFMWQLLTLTRPVEAALAHVDKNEVRRAYNRSDYLEQRRPMMQWWADFVKTADNGSVLEGGIRGLKAIG